MPYDARVLQILIASPGDVAEEREIVSEVIYEWNYINSRDRSIVLLPLRWETHAFPEMGSGPQDVINRQIVDHCDMAIGVFWARLGTPTREAESGTAEELARVGDAGKPVMLYFSQEKVSLENVDVEEYGRLKEFKSKVYPKGLIENYSSPSDFRSKLRRQLAIRIRDIIADDASGRGNTAVAGRRIALTFAQWNPPTILTPPDVLELTEITCTDYSNVPDFTTPVESGLDLSQFGPGYRFLKPNRDYYRELIAELRREALRCKLRLVIKCLSNQSVHDMYLEIRVHARGGKAFINPGPLTLAYPVDTSDPRFFHGSTSDTSEPPDQGAGQVRGLVVKGISKNEWRMEVNIPVIQAKRTVLSQNFFTLEAAGDSKIIFDATVYSSDAPPFPLSAELDVRVATVEKRYRDILKDLRPTYGGTVIRMPS